MSVDCPKCHRRIHYHYEECERHELEKEHLKCVTCGAWFDVKTGRLVAPMTTHNRGIDYRKDFGTPQNASRMVEPDEASELMLYF